MANVKGILFPRSFIMPSDADRLIRSDGDENVQRLHTLLTASSTNHQGWSYRRHVFPVAMAAFGRFAQFLEIQKVNPFLYGYNYEFLIDTLRFIATGRRSVSVQNWFDLLMEHNEPSSDYKVRSMDNFKPFANAVGLSTSDVIAKWCSHSGGVEDLVMSMNIMFGKAKKPLADPSGQTKR